MSLWICHGIGTVKRDFYYCYHSYWSGIPAAECVLKHEHCENVILVNSE